MAVKRAIQAMNSNVNQKDFQRKTDPTHPELKGGGDIGKTRTQSTTYFLQRRVELTAKYFHKGLTDFESGYLECLGDMKINNSDKAKELYNIPWHLGYEEILDYVLNRIEELESVS